MPYHISIYIVVINCYYSAETSMFNSKKRFCFFGVMNFSIVFRISFSISNYCFATHQKDVNSSQYSIERDLKIKVKGLWVSNPGLDAFLNTW